MMMTWINEFWEDESGLGTIELVLLVLILAGMAIAFKGKITDFLKTLTGKFTESTFNTSVDITDKTNK